MQEFFMVTFYLELNRKKQEVLSNRFQQLMGFKLSIFGSELKILSLNHTDSNTFLIGY